MVSGVLPGQFLWFLHWIEDHDILISKKIQNIKFFSTDKITAPRRNIPMLWMEGGRGGGRDPSTFVLITRLLSRSLRLGFFYFLYAARRSAEHRRALHWNCYLLFRFWLQLLGKACVLCSFGLSEISQIFGLIPHSQIRSTRFMYYHDYKSEVDWN